MSNRREVLSNALTEIIVNTNRIFINRPDTLAIIVIISTSVYTFDEFNVCNAGIHAYSSNREFV
jgi:hypothetical protein